MGDDLVDLTLPQCIVAAALDMEVVEQHASRAGLQRHSAATTRLRGVEAPPERDLIAEDNRLAVDNRKAAQDRLPCEGCGATLSLADLLELPGGRPVHVERVGQLARHIASAAAAAEAIDFLKQHDVGLDGAQRGGNPIEL